MHVQRSTVGFYDCFELFQLSGNKNGGLQFLFFAYPDGRLHPAQDVTLNNPLLLAYYGDADPPRLPHGSRSRQSTMSTGNGGRTAI